jgi:hypothetical protein
MTAEFTIQGKLNSSVQIGDNLYFALKTSNSGYQVSNNFIHAGVITDLIQGTTQSTIKFNFTSLANNIPGGINYSSINPNDYFLFFAKDNSVNLNRLKGYFANVLFKNDSEEYAELFTVGAEIQKSSK